MQQLQSSIAVLSATNPSAKPADITRALADERHQPDFAGIIAGLPSKPSNERSPNQLTSDDLAQDNISQHQSEDPGPLNSDENQRDTVAIRPEVDNLNNRHARSIEFTGGPPDTTSQTDTVLSRAANERTQLAELNTNTRHHASGSETTRAEVKSFEPENDKLDGFNATELVSDKAANKGSNPLIGSISGPLNETRKTTFKQKLTDVSSQNPDVRNTAAPLSNNSANNIWETISTGIAARHNPLTSADIAQKGFAASSQDHIEKSRAQSILENASDPMADLTHNHRDQQRAVPSFATQLLSVENTVPLGPNHTGDARLLDPLEIASSTSWEPAANVASSPALNRAEIAAPVLRQIVEVLHKSPDRPIELVLNPEELGRVRMSMTTTDGGISVAILAERPETLDFLRRHIDLLGQDFKALGYENIAFSFGNGTPAEDHPDTGDAGVTPDGTSDQELPKDHTINLTIGPASGVDIRL